MSVINQMLRDLDARGQGGNAARASALAAAGQAPSAARRGPSTIWLRWALAVVTLLLALVVAMMVWTRSTQVTAIEASSVPAPPESREVLIDDEPSSASTRDVTATPPALADAPAAEPAPTSAAPPMAVGAELARPAPEPVLADAVTPPAAPRAEPAPEPAPPRPSRASIERVDAPPSIDALAGAREALASGNAENALAALASADDASAEREALQAAALQQLGRHAEAIDAYTRALRREPDVGAWWAGMGISFESEGRAADALSAFREAQRRGPLDPALADYLGERVEALSAGEPSR